MKAERLVSFILAVAVLIALSGCRELSPADTVRFTEDGKLHYNEKAYIQYANTNGKYQADMDSSDCVELAIRPFGLFYLLGAVTYYYGNDSENPEYIYSPRGYGFYVREDLKIDFDSLLTIQDTEENYSFRISDVITGDKLDYDSYNLSPEKDSFENVCDFLTWVEPDNFAYLCITILKKDDSFYLQDVWDSDLYLLKNAFVEDLDNLGFIGKN